MALGASALVGDLGNLFTVRVDPTWPYLDLWDGGELGDVLRVTFFDFDEGITEASAVAYANQDILGRAETLMSYTGTSSREVPLTFRFRAQGQLASGAGERAGGSNLTSINNPTQVDSSGRQARDRTSSVRNTLTREVRTPALWLEALKYPVIDAAGIAHAPPPVILSIGSLLTMRAVVTNAQIQWLAPFDPETLLPFGADVSVSFTAVSVRPRGFSLQGSSRWNQSLGGVDGPANPFSGLGGGRSGTSNPTGTPGET